MENWIDKKSGEFDNNRADQLAKQSGPNLGSYWTALKEQIMADVEQINAQFISFLQIDSVIVENLGDDPRKYRIAANVHADYTVVYVMDVGQEIDLEIVMYNSKDGEIIKTESFNVIELGNLVILSRMKEEYLVPSQASEYILSSIVEIIKHSVRNQPSLCHHFETRA